MKLVAIPSHILVNPEHISSIIARPDHNDGAYVVYTITMYNDHAFNIRLRDWNEYFPFGPLFAAYPGLANRLNGDAR
jgi:hypothetical protein